MTALDDILAAAGRDEAPDTVLLMRLLGEATSEAEARAALAQAMAAADAAGATRLARLQQLWDAHPEAWPTVRSTLRLAAHDRADPSGEAALAYWAATFDRLAAAAPLAGVALYALGSPDLLAAATAEIVALADRLHLLDPSRDALDLGCGIGRLTRALAPRLRSIVGLDVSGGMVAEARRRCADLANVAFVQGSGRDLTPIPAASVDLVLAVDVFPYLVQAGLAVKHVGEMARVLRPGGAGLILNFSYRGAPAQDCADVDAAARTSGLDVLAAGRRDLHLWDGATFLLRKPAAAAGA